MIISLSIPPVFFQSKFILFFLEIVDDECVDLSVAPGLTAEKEIITVRMVCRHTVCSGGMPHFVVWR